MSKTIKNQINTKVVLGLRILAILTVLTMAFPTPAKADALGFVTPYNSPVESDNYSSDNYSYQASNYNYDNYESNSSNSQNSNNYSGSTYTPASYNASDYSSTPIVYSNSPVRTKTVTKTVNTNTAKKTSTTNTNNTNTDTGYNSENYSNLASNAFFGSNGVLPNGLLQWIFFLILVLLIVLLVRRLFGATDRYHAEPLKHA